MIMDPKLKSSIKNLLNHVQNMKIILHNSNTIDELELNKYYYCLGHTKASAEFYENSNVLTILKNLDKSIANLLEQKSHNADMEQIINAIAKMREHIQKIDF